MTYVAIVTLLLLIQYAFFAIQAGVARGKDTVVAPAISGDEMYERKLRVQMNTVEQLIITLPAMWICAHFFRADVAAILGLIFFVGRIIYSISYVKNPKSRAPGFIISFFSNVILMGCGLWGAISGAL